MDEATKLLSRFYIGSAPSRSFGFTYIVLCAKEYQPNAHLLAPANILRMPFSDTEEALSPLLCEQLDGCANLIANQWRKKHRVLVSCIMGRNRSALLSSLALSKITGCHPSDAAILVQEKRIDPVGVHALDNPVFWDYLMGYPNQ